MEESVEYALIAFINSKPDGNMLRDIAIRTLKDIMNKEETHVYPELNENKRYLISRPIKTAVKPKDHLRVNRSEINSYTRKNLKKLRNKAMMYQADMARKFGVIYETYRNYENGTEMPPDLVINVCRAFEIPVEKFMTELI